MWQREEYKSYKKREREDFGMRSGLCVCVCVGHSTVPYIKLSAPQLSSSSKWSLLAWGGFVSQLWIKSKECPKPRGHCFCESSNSEDKDRCLSFCLHVCLCAPARFCVVCRLCAHCMHHLQSYSVSFVVNMTHSQCQSHVSVFKLSKKNAQPGCTIHCMSYMLSILTWNYWDLVFSKNENNESDGRSVIHQRACW